MVARTDHETIAPVAIACHAALQHCLHNGTEALDAVFTREENPEGRPVSQRAAQGVSAKRRPFEKGALLVLDKPVVNTFSHVKPGDTPWISDGLRAFSEYRDLGIADTTGGHVIAQLVRAREAPEKGRRLAPASGRLPHRPYADGLGEVHI